MNESEEANAMLTHSLKRRTAHKRAAALRNLISDVGTVLAFAVIGAILFSSSGGCRRSVALLGQPELEREIVQVQ
jgi:hypothetical protein